MRRKRRENCVYGWIRTVMCGGSGDGGNFNYN